MAPADFTRLRASLRQQHLAHPKTPYGTLECSICSENRSPFEFVSPLHQPCTEEVTVCEECWTAHVQAQLETKATAELCCLQCEASLSEQDLKQVLPAAAYQSYVTKALLETMRQDPDWYECPSADCRYGHIQPKSFGNVFTCKVCGSQYCIQCNAVHSGESCAVYQQRIRTQDPDVASTQRFLKNHTKPCPHCGVPIQRRSGCDDMKCTSCKGKFCWNCLARYKGTGGLHTQPWGTVHLPTCPHHPDNLTWSDALIAVMVLLIAFVMAWTLSGFLWNNWRWLILQVLRRIGKVLSWICSCLAPDMTHAVEELFD